MNSDWVPVSLGELIEIKHGFAFKGEYITEQETANLLLTPGNFSIGGGFQFKKQKFYSGEVPPGYVLFPGDLIVTMTDLSKEADTLGYSAIVPNSRFTMLHNQRLGRVYLKSEKTTLNFINWVLRSPTYRNEILANYTGSTVKHTSPSKILAYEFSLPPLSEQREIAAILGALDDKIELNRKTATTLEEMARTLYRSWFVDFDPVHAKVEGRAPAHMDAETAALFPDTFGEDGLPEGWKSAHFLEFIELVGGGTPKTSETTYWNGDIPWYSVVDAPQNGEVFVHTTEKNITEKGLANSAVTLIRKGATIISARGTVGKLAMVGRPMTFNQSCYGLLGRNQNLDAFVYFATSRAVELLQAMSHGSVFSTITRKTFEGLTLTACPDNVAQAFEHFSGQFLERIHLLGLENQTLAALRDTLLPRLMSGELRVSAAREMIEEVA